MFLREVIYKVNHATHHDILLHLRECSDSFIPPLEYRADINTYASKIESLADTIEAWAKGDLIGLIAVYCNDLENRQAYITSVSIKKNFIGKGIASKLLKMCIKHVKDADFIEISLDVHEKNYQAIVLYERNGFKRIGMNNSIISMRCDVNDESRL